MKKTIEIKESILLRIDGEYCPGCLLNREQFIEKFNELQTLLLTDREDYWVLYDERFPETPYYTEIFWCIPREEIMFVNIDHQWYLHELDDVPSVYVLDNIFDNFYAMFMKYCGRYTRYAKYPIELDPCVLLCFVRMDKMDISTREAFIGYLLEYWQAYTMSILNGEFKYMNCTEIVYSSWVDYITKK